MADGRVLIADGNPLAAEPSWERFDEIPNCLSPGWDLTTGRQQELLERTDTGSATVLFNDRARVIDDPELVGKAIQLQIHDPLTDTWEPQFRGVIDEPDYDLDPSEVKANVALKCVDMFAYLATVQAIPGWHGDVPPSNLTGLVVYGEEPVDERIEDVLADCGIPDELSVVFSGNVILQETRVDGGDSLLNVIRDAADAELPGIANIFCDRRGRICFHGRYAVLDPVGVAAGAGSTAWDFQQWKAGNGAAVAADTTRGQIRRFAWNYPSSRIYNSAIAWPRGLEQSEMANQTYLDEDSINAYGYRAMPPMGDLIVKQHKTNGNTGAEECQLYTEFFVENLKAPARYVREVTIKTVRPTDGRAAATWPLLTRMDIADTLNLTVTSAGVSDETYSIQGFTKSIRQLDPDFDYVEVTPNLTPIPTYNPFD